MRPPLSLTIARAFWIFVFKTKLEYVNTWEVAAVCPHNGCVRRLGESTFRQTAVEKQRRDRSRTAGSKRAPQQERGPPTVQQSETVGGSRQQSRQRQLGLARQRLKMGPQRSNGGEAIWGRGGDSQVEVGLARATAAQVQR